MPIRPPRLRNQALQPNLRVASAPLLRGLSRREAPLVAVVLGTVLCLPALFSGFSLADLLLQMHALGHPDLPIERPAYDLFSWIEPRSEEIRAIADLSGVWSVPAETSVRAPRPATSLLHAAEFALWPTRAWLMHAQNLTWYAILVAIAAATYRRLFGAGWVAAAAVLLFAVDDAHGPVVAAIASRHQLIGAVLGIAALLAHHRWRAEGWAPGAWVGPVAFAGALAASETAIGSLGLLLAYVIVLERAPGPQQWGSFAAYLALAVIWLAVTGALGYSIADPLIHPLLSLATMAERVPLLALGSAGLPFIANAPLLGPPWSAMTAVSASLIVGVLVAVLAPFLARNAIARFWALGAAFALLPAALGEGGDGATLLPSLGASALVAQYFAAVLKTAHEGRLASLHAPVAALAVTWLVLHAVAAPLLLPIRTLAPRLEQSRRAAIASTLPTESALADQQLVIVNSPDLTAGPGLLLRRAADGEVMPESTRVLVVGDGPVRLERIAEDRVVATVADGVTPLPIGPLAPVVTAAAATFAAGDEVDVEGFRAKIESVEDGRATRIEFTFDVPCGNESLRWIAWDGEQYRSFVPPPVGEALIVGGT